jgi:DNA-binding XRE family transcriptional regulator
LSLLGQLSADDNSHHFDNPALEYWADALTSKPLRIHNLAIGRVVRDLRLASGYSQEAFGFEAGLDRSYISLLERGRRSPTLDTIVCLCAVFDLTLSEMIALVDAKLDDLNES